MEKAIGLIIMLSFMFVIYLIQVYFDNRKLIKLGRTYIEAITNGIYTTSTSVIDSAMYVEGQ